MSMPARPESLSEKQVSLLTIPAEFGPSIESIFGLDTTRKTVDRAPGYSYRTMDSDW
jgi:hypothetical protein